MCLIVWDFSVASLSIVYRSPDGYDTTYEFYSNGEDQQAVSYDEPGVYHFECQAEDDMGNTATGSVDVTVRQRKLTRTTLNCYCDVLKYFITMDYLSFWNEIYSCSKHSQ